MDVKIAALRQSFRHLTARLRQDFKNRLAVVDVEPLASRHFKQPRVEAELVQDRGVDVGDVAPGLMLFVATRAVPFGSVDLTWFPNAFLMLEKPLNFRGFCFYHASTMLRPNADNAH